MFTSRILGGSFILLATAVLCSGAEAQLFRSYLSAAGSDANPCTVDRPCRLLPAALAAVKDGGEVWIVDSANFNTAPVNISKSVSILAIPGALGSIVGSGGDAIEIATAGVKVTLRNLKILNFDAGVNGIHLTSGASLKVEGCEIVGFASSAGSGIRVMTPATVTIVDTIVRDNFDGIWFDNGAKGDVVRTTIVGNPHVGIWAYPTMDSTVSVTVSDSVANNNGWGFYVTSLGPSAPSKMTVSRSTASLNTYDGFGTSSTSTALMIVSGSVATGNQGYGFRNTGGTFRSLGNNTVFDNWQGDTVGTITPAPPR